MGICGCGCTFCCGQRIGHFVQRARRVGSALLCWQHGGGLRDARGEGEEEEFVELDLEKTLTWTGNAVSIQAGGEFRLPLIVPHPSVLAIQFEVEGGYDIEFSLTFQDDHEDGSSQVRSAARASP